MNEADLFSPIFFLITIKTRDGDKRLFRSPDTFFVTDPAPNSPSSWATTMANLYIQAGATRVEVIQHNRGVIYLVEGNSDRKF